MSDAAGQDQVLAEVLAEMEGLRGELRAFQAIVDRLDAQLGDILSEVSVLRARSSRLEQRVRELEAAVGGVRR